MNNRSPWENSNVSFVRSSFSLIINHFQKDMRYDLYIQNWNFWWFFYRQPRRKSAVQVPQNYPLNFSFNPLCETNSISSTKYLCFHIFRVNFSLNIVFLCRKATGNIENINIGNMWRVYLYRALVFCRQNGFGQYTLVCKIFEKLLKQTSIQ